MSPALRGSLKRLLLRTGPPVRCTACGAVLFRGVAIVAHGRVKLVGADAALVRVDWVTTSRLGFCHVDQASCRRAAAGAPQ